MRRFTVLSACCAAAYAIALLPSAAGAAAFTQCPSVYKDTGCQFLFTVTDTETTVQSDPSQGPYEGTEDALIGIQNNSSKPLSSIPISAEENLFGFENDGICSPGGGPVPTGCVVLPETALHAATTKAGQACTYEGEVKEGNRSTETVEEACGFMPPAGEPAGVTFPEGVSANGYANGDAVSGYEGPTSWYTNIAPFGSFPFGSGVVNFFPAIPPGGSTYFSLESPPVGGFGSSSSLTTALSGGGQLGASISVVQGTAVTDSATLGGTNAGIATGPVGFNVYSDRECRHLVTGAGSARLSGGSAGPSSAESLAPGKYYWQAVYGGSLQAQAVASTCGGEILTVLAATTTSTAQTGGGLTAASLIVPFGTAVSDKATIAGSLAAGAMGTVSYVLYKDSKCLIPAVAGGAAAVVGSAAGASAAVKPAVGTYYWRASYSGDTLNAPSTSACGSEVLTVAKKTPLGLAVIKGCVSKRHFIIHPKAPRGVRLLSVKEYINGRLVLTAKLTRRHTTVDLRGFPKGTYKLELVATSNRGKVYEDTRTFHTCVPGHHKKKKK